MIFAESSLFDQVEIVMQDAAPSQKVVDELDNSHFIAAMRESDRSVSLSQVKYLDQAFSDIRANAGL